MSRRIPLPHLAGAALVHYWRRGAVELGGPMRALNMKATKPVIFHSSTPKLSIGDKTRAEALLSGQFSYCLLYTSPSPRDRQKSRMPSSA